MHDVHTLTGESCIGDGRTKRTVSMLDVSCPTLTRATASGCSFRILLPTTIPLRLLDRYVFNDVEQCSTTALFTARADGRSESLPPLDFCKACLWQVMDASIDLRDPNPN